MPTHAKPVVYLLAVAAISFWPAPLAAQEQDPAQLWIDYNHYVRIARTDLAQASAQVLLERVDDDQLLDLVESGEYPDYERTFIRAAKIETLAQVTAQLRDRIQGARIKRSRDPERIAADIVKLAQSIRSYPIRCGASGRSGEESVICVGHRTAISL